MSEELSRLKRLENYSSHVIIARDGNLIIGWCLLFSYDENTEEAYFYVRAKHRRKGIATQLYERALELSEGRIIEVYEDMHYVVEKLNG
jgi:GNAT superfamily N-acetyltransferase